MPKLLVTLGSIFIFLYTACVTSWIGTNLDSLGTLAALASPPAVASNLEPPGVIVEDVEPAPEPEPEPELKVDYTPTFIIQDKTAGWNIPEATYRWEGILGDAAIFQYGYDACVPDLKLERYCIIITEPMLEDYTEDPEAVAVTSYDRYYEGIFDITMNPDHDLEYWQYDEVVAHEIGHVLGLGHNDDITSCMFWMTQYDPCIFTQEDVERVTAYFERGWHYGMAAYGTTDYLRKKEVAIA